jgi:hypothetical protein
VALTAEADQREGEVGDHRDTLIIKVVVIHLVLVTTPFAIEVQTPMQMEVTGEMGTMMVY